MYPEQQNGQPQGYTPPQQDGVGPYPQQPVQPQQPTYSPQPSQQSWNMPAEPEKPLTPDGIAPIDYLNQIATPPKQSFGFTRKQVAIFGGILLVTFGVIAALALSRGAGPDLTEQSQRLVLKSSGLAKATEESVKSIKSRKLSALNSSLHVQLTSATTTMTEVFTSRGINVSKPSKELMAVENNTALLEKLEDASLSGVFDRVYAREMAYQLDSMLISLRSIYSATKNAELKEKLETIYNNLQPIQKQLSEFDSATS